MAESVSEFRLVTEKVGKGGEEQTEDLRLRDFPERRQALLREHLGSLSLFTLSTKMTLSISVVC